jgi:hypothetical protein
MNDGIVNGLTLDGFPFNRGTAYARSGVSCADACRIESFR